MKRIFLVHGWSGSPGSDWLPWLKGVLEERAYHVEAPLMPNPDEPTIQAWVDCLAQTVGSPDEETYFVGHSIGCQTILRYVEHGGVRIGGAVFVAGWFELTNVETDEEKRIGKPWLETPMDFERIRQFMPQSIALFSSDDPVVPLEVNGSVFEEKLGSKIIVEEGKGHFTADDGVIQSIAILDATLALLQ